MRKSYDTFKNVFDSLSMRSSFFGKLRVLTLRKRWHMLVGEAISRRSRIHDYRNGILYVAVTEGLWAYEISLHKKALKDRLNEELGAQIIKSIRVIIEPTHNTEESDEKQV